MYFLFQDNFSPEQFKKIVKELISETNCPVCKDTVQLPVHLCANGHGVCGKCYNNSLNNCQKCAQPFSSNSYTNVLLNKVLDLLPRKCRYDGCKEFITPGDEHEKWCGYQPTTCKVEKCEWTGCGKEISHHIVKDHYSIRQFSETNSKCSLFVELFNETPCTLFAHGHIFWVILSKVENVLAVKFYHVPNGKIKSPLKITLGFENSKKSLSSSIYVTPDNVLDEEETSMSFVLSRVLSLVDVVIDPPSRFRPPLHKTKVSITVKKD